MRPDLSPWGSGRRRLPEQSERNGQKQGRSEGKPGMQVEPQKKDRRDQEQERRMLLSSFHEPEREAGKSEGKHLGTRPPGRRGGQSGNRDSYCRSGRLGRAAQIEQHETGSCHDGGKEDEAANAAVPPDLVEHHLGQPLVRYPWIPSTSKGERVGVWNMPGLHDPLPGAQMPPQIGISGAPRRHGEQAEKQDSCERADSV